MQKHIYTLLAALLLGLLAQQAQAQQAFGKLVAGLEVGFDVNQFTEGLKPRLVPSFQLEAPIGPFSIGAGIGTEIYREYEYYTYAGQTIERMEDGKLVPYYVSNLNAFRPAYWTVPVKIDYRFHRCNCVYVQAGMSFHFFNDRPEGSIKFEGAELRERPLDAVPREILFKKNTKSYTLGVGFSLYTHRFFRFTARPSFVLRENPEIYTSAPKYLSTLRMNFGFQVGLFRNANW
jgi:hypothetical protein